MAQDATQITVGANGDVYAGATSTPAPTDSTTGLNGGFANLGLVSEDGATLTLTRTLTDITAWQSFSPVKRIVTARDATVEFTMLQTNKANTEFAWGGAVTGGTGVAEVQAVVLASYSGVKTFKVTYGGQESPGTVTRGTNFTPAGIKAVIEGITGIAGSATVTVQDVTDTGFLVSFNQIGVRTMFSITNGSAGATGTVGQLVAGAAAGSPPYLWTPDAGPTAPAESSLVVEWTDGGSKHYRIYFPKVIVTSDNTMQLVRTDAARVPVTVSAIPDAGVPPCLLYTDDAAYA